MALFRKKNVLDARKNLDRTSQLLSDYKRVTELFKAHPFIAIREVFGAPPEKYHFLYRIDGLEKIKNTIEVKNEHVVEIALPPKYPDAAPLCKRVSALFHPNISDDQIDIKEYWKPGVTLADLVVTIGEMIAFQKYDTRTPINAEAAKWADRNTSMLPLSKADLRYKEPEQMHVDAPGSDVIIQEQEPDDTPRPEDGRRTEGIIVDTGTEQITIADDSASSSPNVEMRETAVLRDDKTDTAIVAPAQPAGARPAQVEKKAEPPAPSVAHPGTSPAPAPEPPVSHEREKDTEVSMPAVMQEDLPRRQPKEIDAVPRSQGIICPKCSSRNAGVANFCSNCGTRIRHESFQPGFPMAKVLLVSILVSVPVAIISVGLTLIIVSQTRPAPVSIIETSPVASAPVPATPAAPPAVEKPFAPAKDTLEARTLPKEPAAALTNAPKAPRAGALTAEQKQARIDEALKTAQTYVNLGSYDEALNKYMYVLKLDPKNDDALDGLQAVRDAKDKASADSAKGKK
jgi:ubiquitin-protein ligase